MAPVGSFSTGLRQIQGNFKSDGFVLVRRAAETNVGALTSLRTEILRDFTQEQTNWRYQLWRKFNSVATSKKRHSVPLRLTPSLREALNSSISSVRPFLDAELSPIASLVELSAMISLPGALDQALHSDTPYVVANDTIITGFIALSPVTMLHGPTCLFPGTHTKEFHDSIPTTPYAHYYSADGNPEAEFLSEERRPRPREEFVRSRQSSIFAVMDVGDILMFDTRVLHYGSGNMSEEPRPLVAFSFQGPSNDHIHGFTYHCHGSVRGRWQLQNFHTDSGEP
mmetsp:Transcript_29490/g.83182  ORF Transcript_29490/g.83182 Transcript_29490/m.83182 type:complete len:282 (-) Transcript_29490:296-1141(-)